MNAKHLHKVLLRATRHKTEMVFTSCVQPQKDELRPSESGEDINDVSDTDNLTGAILEA